MADLTKPRDLDAILARRRGRSASVRDLTDGLDRPPARAGAFLSPLRWLLGIAAQIVIVALVLLAILAVPPVLACSERAQHGFFAGNTFGTCAAQGISARMGAFEQKVRRLILVSGQ